MEKINDVMQMMIGSGLDGSKKTSDSKNTIRE
jgi:hypothetical protein